MTHKDGSPCHAGAPTRGGASGSSRVTPIETPGTTRSAACITRSGVSRDVVDARRVLSSVLSSTAGKQSLTTCEVPYAGRPRHGRDEPGDPVRLEFPGAAGRPTSEWTRSRSARAPTPRARASCQRRKGRTVGLSGRGDARRMLREARREPRGPGRRQRPSPGGPARRAVEARYADSLAAMFLLTTSVVLAASSVGLNETTSLPSKSTGVCPGGA